MIAKTTPINNTKKIMANKNSGIIININNINSNGIVIIINTQSLKVIVYTDVQTEIENRPAKKIKIVASST